MKNIGIYILGVIAGIVLFLFVDEITPNNKEDNILYNIKGIALLKDKGNCLDYKMLEVFQVLDNGAALVYAFSEEYQGVIDNIDKEGFVMGQMVKSALTNLGYNDSLPILLINPEGQLFYDEEKIEVQTGKCLRQVGTYSYTTIEDMQKTVPVAVIE